MATRPYAPECAANSSAHSCPWCDARMNSARLPDCGRLVPCETGEGSSVPGQMRVSATDEPAFFSMLGVIVEDNLGPKPVARLTGGTRKALGSGHRADDSDVEEGCDMEACDARG